MHVLTMCGAWLRHCGPEGDVTLPSAARAWLGLGLGVGVGLGLG